jgi:hypothetical protein
VNELRSQELVVGCLAGTAAVAAGSDLASGQVPGLRLVIGLAFTGVGLATASMFAPDLAGTFAVLILTTTVFVYGGPLMDAVTHLTSNPQPTGTVKRPAAPTGVIAA